MQHLAHAYESIEPSIPQELFTTIREVNPRRLNGFAAFPGIIEGPCTIIRDLKDLHCPEGQLPYVKPFCQRWCLSCHLWADWSQSEEAPYRSLQGMQGSMEFPLCLALRDSWMPSVTAMSSG